MLYKTFDYVMRKLGRKYAFVDVYGDVLSYRYYVFFMENKTAKTWKDKYLPNLFVHHFVGAENKQWVDNEISHTHPWNTVSIVIKGGYVEEENYSGLTKEINAPAVVFRDWKSSHRFTQVTPNTWTLWFHSIRKREGKWAFDLRPHDVVCPACVKHNNGVCINAAERKEFVDPKPKSAQNHKWREPTWMKCDSELEQVIAQRKKVLTRAKTYIPVTINERYEVAKETLVKDLVREKAELSKA
jgi:hypothetical protein